MKKIIRKAGLIIMALSFLYLTGCKSAPEQAVDRLYEALEEKYGESFTAVKMGDRINTSSVGFYVHPENNGELLFTARLTSDGKLEDDYVVQKVCHTINTELMSQLEQAGMKSKIQSSPSTVNQEEIDAIVGDYTPQSLKQCIILNFIMPMQLSKIMKIRVLTFCIML